LIQSRNELDSLERGFSLIEMMIVTSIIGILMLGFINLTASQIKISKSMNDDNSFIQLQRSIHQIINESQLCKQGFVGAQAPNINMVDAQTLTGTEVALSFPDGSIVKKDSPIMSGDLTVRSFRWIKAIQIGSDPVIAGNNLWSGQLKLVVEKNGDVFGPKILNERTLDFMTISVSALDQMQSCMPSGGSNVGFNYQNCGPDTVMTGISAGGPLCSKMPAGTVGAAAPTIPLTAFSASNPGPGCVGHDCVTYDFGICNGHLCKTNGPVCYGHACCAGPACF
jgi:prepilin-type N-terminal cleavage/methylation domain-containing protein